MNHLPLVKAHAYGNDFLYVRERELEGIDPVPLARRLCERHRGAGADGLIVYEPTPEGARMRLVNADGSAAELSGNGLRALAALVIRDRGNPSQVVPGAEVTIETAAGPRFLTLVERSDPRFTFRAWMGEPSGVQQETIEAGGESLVVSTFAIGNPQCVVLGDVPDDDRFARIGPALERHPRFPDGTNVEFAHVVASDRVDIRIWERGVGPTESSGTGACAAAIAAIAHGGAARALEVVAPGGNQQVEWKSDGVWLTGWAEILWEGRWLADV